MDKIAYSYIMGHGNVNIKISPSNVATLILLLLPQSVLTHRNGVYGYGLYNIETEILISEQEQTLKETTDTKWNQVTDNLDGKHICWCSDMIEKCEKLFEKMLILSEDDGLYSYFRALIQTLNTLSQYESFALSRDIFELIVPSFQMFQYQLNKSMCDIDNVICRERIKDCLMQYLECVNSVIYHTIHTDQVYLMIPGYSGTSFSIPIKLSMFYSWFIEKVGSILNDADRKYSCIIKPVMESRPITRVININPQEKDMLICVQLAQHSLYKPSELFIILAHEIAHYVNRNSRRRQYRSDCITRTVVYCIAEGICNVYLSETPINFGAGIVEELVKCVYKKLLNELYAYIWGIMLSEFPDGAHSKELGPALKWICREVMTQEGRENCICKIIRRIPTKVTDMIDEEDDIGIEQMRLIYRIQNEMDKNRRELLASQTIERVIDDLIIVYKEVFSDIAASVILDCTEEQFIEAFTVSEGARKGGDECMKSREHRIRVNVLRSTVFSQKSKKGTNTKQEVIKNNPSKEMYVELYNYAWVQKWLLIYAQEVYKKMKGYISETGIVQEVEEIKNAFRILSNSTNNAERAYLLIEEKVKNHKMNVIKKIDENRENCTIISG